LSVARKKAPSEEKKTYMNNTNMYKQSIMASLIDYKYIINYIFKYVHIRIFCLPEEKKHHRPEASNNKAIYNDLYDKMFILYTQFYFISVFFFFFIYKFSQFSSFPTLCSSPRTYPIHTIYTFKCKYFHAYKYFFFHKHTYIYNTYNMCMVPFSSICKLQFISRQSPAFARACKINTLEILKQVVFIFGCLLCFFFIFIQRIFYKVE
jgi:hypothetical protein